jgi:DsbC/DsbD-like thiol-disulfide interchange protein
MIIIKHLLCLVVLPLTIYTQEPVRWKFSAIKTAEREYTIRITGHIQEGWHIYAIRQPENFIGKPTTIRFNRHPLIVIEGVLNEMGSMVKRKEEEMGIESWEYERSVEYVQKIKLKSASKTALTGNIEFQSCTNEICLAPSKIDFSIMLNDH